MRVIGFIFVILLIFSSLNGCIVNERIFEINVESSHTWTIYLDIIVNGWYNYSEVEEIPEFYVHRNKTLYINGKEDFDVKLDIDKIKYIEIRVKASTIDGYYDEYVLPVYDLKDKYYFEVIGSGNNVHIIERN